MTATNVTRMKPSLLQHCETVYDRMKEEARQLRDDANAPILVWEGHTTKLLRSLGLSTPYYSFVRNALIDMGCVRQLRRGGGNSTSQWELLRRPTHALWDKLEEAPGRPTSSVNATDVAALTQKLGDLTDRFDRLEDNFKALLDIVNDKIGA